MGIPWKIFKIAKKIIKYIVYNTPLKPIYIGKYLRNKYFLNSLKNLPLNSYRNVLDAGCGDGDYVIKLPNAYPHLFITGYDLKEGDSWNKTFPKNVRLQKQDLLLVSEEDYYDFCYSIEVLEHIPNNHRVMENIYRALKPGGLFFLHMPGANDFRILPKRMFIEKEFWAKEEHIGEHYNLIEIQDVLKTAGFNIYMARSTFNFCGKIAWELDYITREKKKLKIFLMPLLKLMATADM